LIATPQPRMQASQDVWPCSPTFSQVLWSG